MSGRSRGPSAAQQAVAQANAEAAAREKADIERRSKAVENRKSNPFLHVSPSGQAPSGVRAGQPAGTLGELVVHSQMTGKGPRKTK